MSAAASSSDRFGASALLAVLVHGLLLLGITFVAPRPGALLPTLDVILVESSTPKPPEQPDYLAQANQTGGGDTPERVRPAEIVSSPVPITEAGLEATPNPPRSTPPQPPTEENVIRAETAAPGERSPPERPERELPTAAELIDRTLDMARLASELDRNRQAYAKRPRRKFISANTREYEFAAYMRAWVARVERVGNLNYPEEARRRGLSGELILTVAIRRDGSVESAEIIMSSGEPVLDQAALRIVQLAAPFQALPETKERIDVLHITRTWQFLPSGTLRQR
ncbi:MAG: cell envelope biogenesis protein TonB [Lysobacterales bacterium]|nr:MAG: cell envelope biogenesis protein TonB [Xanthomonadales bacterium]